MVSCKCGITVQGISYGSLLHHVVTSSSGKLPINVPVKISESALIDPVPLIESRALPFPGDLNQESIYVSERRKEGPTSTYNDLR